MASQETLVLAQAYLDKHMARDEDIGVGSFAEKHPIEFVTNLRTRVDGSFLIPVIPPYLDCRVVAERLYLDILADNPELKPRMMTMGGYVQNWVEITDPKTGETIQIDATPWYGCLNPGLVGTDTSDAPKNHTLKVSRMIGPIFAVRRDGDTVLTTIFTGLLAGISSEYKIGILEAAIDGKIPLDAVNRKVDYRFLFQVRATSGDSPVRVISIYVDVLDSALLDTYIKQLDSSPINRSPEVNSLEVLSLLGTVKFGIALIYEGNSPHYEPLNSLRAAEFVYKKMGNSDLFEEFSRNLPRVVRLLHAAKPTLRIFGTDEKVDVRTGRVITGDMKARYYQFLMGVKTLPLGKMHISYERDHTTSKSITRS